MSDYAVLSKNPTGVFFDERIADHLRRAFTFLTVSSIFVGMTGFFQTFAGYILLGAVPDLSLCFAVFLMTFSVYNLNKLTDIGEDAINTPERLRFLAGKKTQMLCISFGAYALSAIIAFLSLPSALPVIFIPLAANALYSSRLLPGIPRLKDIPIMKNAIVALSWALVCTLMPALEMNKPAKAVLLVVYFMMARVFVNTVIFDIRDVDGDRANGIRTIPVILNLHKTTAILLAVNSTLLPWFLVGGSRELLAVIMIIYGYAIILCFRKRRSPLAMELFVDGEWLMACVLFFGIKLIFLS
jgi:4-hydroxybenzoate polyprenyltransferase